MAKPPADISMSYTRVVPERGLPTTNTGIRLRAEMLRVTVFSTAQREAALLSACGGRQVVAEKRKQFFLEVGSACKKTGNKRRFIVAPSERVLQCTHESFRAFH